MNLSHKIINLISSNSINKNFYFKKYNLLQLQNKKDLIKKLLILLNSNSNCLLFNKNYNNNSNILALFESNQLSKSFVTHSLNLKNYFLIKKISNLVLPLIFDYEYLEIMETQPDFHSSLEFALFLHLNIYYPWVTSGISVNYYTKQFSRIKNKKMQEVWLDNNACFHEDLFSLCESDYFNNLQYCFIRSMAWDVKGRAANMKLVELRQFTVKDIPKSKLITNEQVHSCYSMSNFTTRWGSTSCRISFTYKLGKGDKIALYRI